MVVLSIFMKLFCNIETVVVGDENQYYNQSCIPRLNFPCFVIRVILTLPVTIPYLLCSVVFFFPVVILIVMNLLKEMFIMFSH